MKRRITILSVVALAVTLVGLAWFCLGFHEPAYQGKTLRVWMSAWHKNLLANQGSPGRAERDQAQAAIKSIGADALPMLLRMAGAKDSVLKKRLIALASKQSIIRFHLQPADDYHATATRGFSALGPDAKPAVPALIGLLRDKDPQVRASAAQCLSLIGPEAANAVPDLIRTLNAEGNGYGPVLLNSMGALGAIHSEPETVVPLLLEYVNGPRKDWNYCGPAMDALGRYREKARVAVPAILPFLTDPDGSRRFSADAALCAIDPEAAARAQKK
jgi:HEAT repeat protein